MDLLLRGGAAVLLRVGFILLAMAVLLILGLAQTALGAPVVSAEPLPQPPSGGLTMEWLRDLAVFLFCIIVIGLMVWRAAVIDRLVDSLSKILDNEIEKRGLVEPPMPLAMSMASDLDEAWAAEADKVAPPPPPPAPRRPTIVPPPPPTSAKEMAKKFRAKGTA